MSNQSEYDPNEYVPQGFYGPFAATAAAKVAVDQDPRALAQMPPKGSPPMAMDTTGAVGVFAVMTRRHSPIPTPDGLIELNSALVSQFVGI